MKIIRHMHMHSSQLLAVMLILKHDWKRGSKYVVALTVFLHRICSAGQAGLQHYLRAIGPCQWDFITKLFYCKENPNTIKMSFLLLCTSDLICLSYFTSQHALMGEWRKLRNYIHEKLTGLKYIYKKNYCIYSFQKSVLWNSYRRITYKVCS
jgi:hypothetical protein